MKKSSFLLVPLTVLLFVGFSLQSAFAYKGCTESGIQIKWTTPNMTYRVNTSKGPSGNLKAIKAAAATWTKVGSSTFTFKYGGTSTSTNHAKNDGINLVNFKKMGTTGTLAENNYWYYTNGAMIDSDIAVNISYKWSTTLAAGSYDVQDVLTHEFGHSLCLDDLYGSADKEKTMYGYSATQETKKRTLASDDIKGIAHIYH
jgi:hypothetical protein